MKKRIKVHQRKKVKKRGSEVKKWVSNNCHGKEMKGKEEKRRKTFGVDVRAEWKKKGEKRNREVY